MDCNYLSVILVDRNNFLSVKRISVSDSNFYIADNDSNDIAITVLPTAPTDQATGLPVSTIAFATDGAISVVTDGGVVWDITRAAGFNRVSFQENYPEQGPCSGNEHH